MIRRVDFRFEFKKFKKKSKQLVLMYASKNFINNYKGVVADGAVRSSKTFSLTLGQVIYVNQTQNNSLNLWGGVSKEAIDRNYVTPLINVLESIGFTCNRSGNEVEIYLKKETKQTKRLGLRVGARNYYEIKGGDTVRSESKIQGATYYTVMIDEAPKCNPQYIRQSMARTISYGINGKIFFTGNPEGDEDHWFYVEYIKNGANKKLYRLHFTLEDNGSLTKNQIELAKSMYTGTFYRRMIMGEWVAAEGLVYSMFKKSINQIKLEEVPDFADFQFLSIDYGSVNPFRCGLYHIIKDGGREEIFKIDEYSHSGRETKIDKSDSQYVEDILSFLDYYGITPGELRGVIVDPSAKSLKIELRQAGFKVIDGINNVLQGINKVIEAIYKGILKVTEECVYTLSEFKKYKWCDKSARNGEDKPIKDHDHSMDELRYLIYTLWVKKILLI